jgi:uncharacterized ferritin-like protein (DUF455 family)
MKLSEFTRKILLGSTLEDKLVDAKSLEFDEVKFDVPKRAARSGKIEFATKQMKFPKGNFHEVKRRAMALNSFANHELLAVELMAAALVKLPHDNNEQKRVKIGIFNSLKDEQRHFKLYKNRMNELGFEFGDFPLNEFFWKFVDQIEDAKTYFSVMALTFEAANLDFAKYFEEQFRQVNDHATADILHEVYLDEISHVALGVNHLNKWREDKSLWEYYTQNLPFPLTPARSKGQKVNVESRYATKMDQDFVEKLMSYKDDYNVTSRRHWKS